MQSPPSRCGWPGTANIGGRRHRDRYQGDYLISLVVGCFCGQNVCHTNNNIQSTKLDLPQMKAKWKCWKSCRESKERHDPQFYWPGGVLQMQNAGKERRVEVQRIGAVPQSVLSALLSTANMSRISLHPKLFHLSNIIPVKSLALWYLCFTWSHGVITLR